MDPKSRAIVWKDTIDELDIRQWLPGDRWDSAQQAYEQKPETYSVQGRFNLPGNVAHGEYILALAILDPAGMLPSVRFAIRNYFNGGRHPLGRVGVGKQVDDPRLPASEFDDPAKDRSLHYAIESSSPTGKVLR